MKKLNLCFFIFGIIFILFCGNASANALAAGDNSVLATVNTAPGEDGWGTGAVSLATVTVKGKYLDHLVLAFYGSGEMTVTLQKRRVGTTTWTNVATYTTWADDIVIEYGIPDKEYQAIVLNGDYSSGSLQFGFEWPER